MMEPWVTLIIGVLIGIRIEEILERKKKATVEKEG